MLFITGPRQVGKTTITKYLQGQYPNSNYLNWDVVADRNLIIDGQHRVAQAVNLDVASNIKKIIIFDEIHKHSNWKNFLKGFYDLYKDKCKIIVTGSSRLDVYRRGGDSLMGRYFLYTIFPITIGELIARKQVALIYQPHSISDQNFEALWNQNGFPEPLLQNNNSFTTRWKKLKSSQLFREDVRDMSHIQEITLLETMADMIKLQIGQLFNRSTISKKIQVSIPTINRWVKTLQMFYHCFEVKPWSKNIKRSLIKEPKIYLYDWSVIEDVGAKFENFIAVHLKKFVQFHNDCGTGKFELYFLRDKDKNEMDFVVIKNSRPWFVVEAKHSHKAGLSKNLYYFQRQTGADHAFQVVFDLPYIDKDCFSFTSPVMVSAKTFLSQLV